VTTKNTAETSRITAFTLAPENMDDRDSRIRAAIGLERGFLPRVRIRWLRSYYEHLTSRLLLPFQARYAGDLWPPRLPGTSVTVQDLLDPGRDPIYESSGLLCKVRAGDEGAELPLVDLEVEENSPNYPFIEDYWYWFWNWRFDPKI
jgi:hypothetical protein